MVNIHHWFISTTGSTGYYPPVFHIRRRFISAAGSYPPLVHIRRWFISTAGSYPLLVHIHHQFISTSEASSSHHKQCSEKGSFLCPILRSAHCRIRKILICFSCEHVHVWDIITDIATLQRDREKTILSY